MADPRDNLRDMSERVLLGLVVWREARGESDECRTAVAYSILNRVRHPGWWGKTILAVIAKKWQYSSMTDPNDPQLTTWPQYSDDWFECLEIANDVIDGTLPDPAPGADSYYDCSIKPPKWATPNKLVRVIGRISFYNLDGDPA